MADSIITTGQVYTAPDTALWGAEDLEFLTADGTTYLVAGAGATGDLVLFELGPGGAMVEVDTLPAGADTGTSGLSDLVVMPAADGDTVVTLGRYDDNLGVIGVDPDGALALQGSLSGDAGYTGTLTGETLVLDGTTYLYVARYDAPGFDVYQAEADGSLTRVQRVDDTFYRELARVNEIHAATLHGKPMLFTASIYDEEAITVWRVTPEGTVWQEDRAIAWPDGAFARVTDIETVQIEDRAFVLVAGAESDSIAVYRVSRGYQLNLIDVEEDTRDTRFEGITDMEVFEADGRTFVLAGGNDGGVSLFEMTYRGKLVHLESYGDDFDTTLGGISDIEVQVEGNTAYAYIASESEHGVTQLELDLGRSGAEIRGEAVLDTLVGTGGDDLIWGMGRSDVLYGEGGDDRLIDGRGRDEMWGGEGADIFEFQPDEGVDFIMDFEPGIDRIDLTSYGAHSADEVFVAPREQGAIVRVEGDVIRLRNPEGGPYDTDAFADDMFIFG